MSAEKVPVLSNVPTTSFNTITLSFCTVPTIVPEALEDGCLNVSSTNKNAFWIVVSLTTLSSLLCK